MVKMRNQERHVILKDLKSLFNKCLAANDIPDGWKNAIKKRDPKNSWPISSTI